jgi:citrate lyase beta subunit
MRTIHPGQIDPIVRAMQPGAALPAAAAAFFAPAAPLP